MFTGVSKGCYQEGENTMKTKYLLKKITSVLLLAGTVSYGAPNFNMIGYATVSGDGLNTTTGGAGGSTKTVTTLAALQEWAKNREKNTTPEILIIKGKIASSSSVLITIKNGANISILGDETSGGSCRMSG